MARGVRPDADTQGCDLVRGLQRRDVAQDDTEFGAAFLVLFGRRGFQRTDHAPQYLFEVQDAALVDGDLEIVDRGEVPEMPFLPFLEVEQLQMGDHALAVPKQFQHVLGGKFRKLERDAVPAAQAGEPVKQHMGRHPEQFRRVRRVVRHVGRGQLGIAFGLEPRFHDHFGREHVHAPDKLCDLALAFAGGGEGFLLQCLDPLDKVLEERLVRVFGEMEERGLPGPHIGKERLGLKKRNGDFELLGQSRGVLGVPQLERIHDVALHPEGCLAPFVHEGDHRPLGEEGQKRLWIGETARGPDETDEAIPERRAEFQADADVDSHDLGGLQQFACGGWLNVVVIDDGDIPDALDPCVHDQVRRVFAALGVGVMDVVVHGKLVPLLGHFQQMVCIQELAHEAGVPGRDLPEIVHELELRQLILARPDDLLHDLDEDAARIVPEGRAGAVQHLVAEDAQGHESVRSAAGFEVAEQVDDRVGHPVLVGRRQFQDAMRMKIGVKDLVLKVLRGAVIDRFVDHTQEFTILLVEKKCSEHGQS